MAATKYRADMDIEEFRIRLLNERDRTRNLHSEQKAELEAPSGEFTTEDAVPDDNEQGDTGAVLADKARVTAQDNYLADELRDIEHALERIDDGSYGWCEVTGLPIPIARLRAIPWATMTVEAAERAIR